MCKLTPLLGRCSELAPAIGAADASRRAHGSKSMRKKPDGDARFMSFFGFVYSIVFGLAGAVLMYFEGLLVLLIVLYIRL